MMGTAVELGRRQGDARFYDAARARRGNQRGLPKSRWSPADAAQEKVPSAAAAPGVSGNLERFVAAVTPSVPAQYPSKRAARGWRTNGVDGDQDRPYFVLRDVWEAYGEWSAYGAGVPLMLDGCDGVVQYYVPYLSAIQLYGDPAVLRTSTSPSRHMMNDSDGDSHESSSDASSDCGNGRLKHLTREGFSSDDGESGDPHDRLLFQYLEFDSPFCREPLTDKVSSLSARFPGLKSLKSSDLSLRSWISVAWYPIYRIPTGPTLKDLDACFLTFHRLSTRVGDHVGAIQYAWGSSPNISLPVFGMASYKFSKSVWSSNDEDWQLASGLLQAAADWLRDSRASHPDYQFFVSRGAYNR
ncbi:hypothetical protein SEVIR_5G181000v4 [Setaria viridis]|uniref:DUF789 domain-containing protein n=1 Tax=Setaria viridis TaxID=4556 RepID=A0A4U6UU65_SETVI|nr:uncharacterized protein LOC117857779 isoform X1 [Setaria viridis]TKW14657.1 hypothetical protein SEVIR_5G181000v2 [Setaria viridis]